MDCQDFIRFNQRCVSAVWNEESSQWTTAFRDERSDEETTPSFGGQDRFKGRVSHTAVWPEDVDVRGKRIAVLGNGASGIQCVSALRDEAGEIIHFAPHPTWLGPEAFVENPEYDEQEKLKFCRIPQAYHDFRMGLEKAEQRGKALVKRSQGGWAGSAQTSGL
ncbi:hypothetical protein BDV38DRAFT_278573 [Aspergillus pseudotamarii]|uniref:L-ornithine N(5)-oxygenase n=1 Tax=Aspergillus pseudotamarii TaxID=132259 RepID=A0A5N6T667_ASPPS|nr:uncharacterized protein BDV38DRAFT_278573 [Aspergillus pseudotamarii]KAE8141790.1 hypothetical protein BDV38DRAFT_278573 [Aspergillus pseudotamarii]